MKKLALLAALAAANAFPQCTVPTILPSTASPSITVNWSGSACVSFTYDTDVASDTAAFVALSTGTPDQYDLPTGIGQWWNTSGASDLTGVTHHVTTPICGLRPGNSFAFNVRSRCTSGGAPVLDQSHLRFAYEVDTGQTATWSPTITAPALVPSNPASFNLLAYGGHTVYNGYTLPIEFRATQGAGSDTSLTATLSGVPACMTREFSGWTSQFASGSVITTNLTNFRDHGVNVRLTANSCATGNYTITVSYVASPSGWTGSSNFVVTVANLTAFSSGTPASYPAIPCWQHTSTMIGGGACAQNFDDTLIGTEAAKWAGTFDIGSHASGGCANTNFPGIGSAGDQWPEYYDGARVFNQMFDYVTTYPASTTNALAMYRQAALDCGNKYYASATTIGQNQVPGRWTFALGAVQNWQRYGLTAAQTFLVQANPVNSILPNFSNWKTSYTWENIEAGGLREATYNCDWQLQWRKFNGTDTTQQMQWCVDILLGMIDQVINGTATIEQGFFDGLISDTLLKIYTDPDGLQDARIPVALQALADHLEGPTRWAPTSGNPHGWCLNCRKTDIGMPGGDNSQLNLMTVKPYGWLFRNMSSAGTAYQVFGDTAFQYGVLGYSTFHGKGFSESMRSSPDYIAYRVAPSTPPTVVITPANPIIPTLGSQQFSSSPTGATWSLSAGCAGSLDSTNGSFVGTSTAETCTVTATVSGTPATTSVTTQAPTVTPSTISMNVGATQQFAANFSGSWSVDGGTITSSGLYTAPQVNGTYTITFTATNGGATATATATVTGQQTFIPLSLSPNSWTEQTTINTTITKAFTASNIGSGAVTPTVTLTGSGNFSISANTCTGAVSGGGNCSVTIQFVSTTVGTFSGTLNISDTAGGNQNLPLSVSIPSGTTVGISPLSISVPINGSQQFSATTSNGSTVTWTSSCGSVASTGFFTAPSSPNVCTVTATSTDGSGASGIASVTIVSVSVNPSSVTLQINSKQQFTANVAARWSTGCGTITAGGLLTAPSSPASCSVVATASNGGATGTASVTVVNPPPGTQGGSQKGGKGRWKKFN